MVAHTRRRRWSIYSVPSQFSSFSSFSSFCARTDSGQAGYALKPPLKAAKTLIVHSSRCTNLQSEKTIGKTRATVAGVFPIFLFLI